MEGMCWKVQERINSKSLLSCPMLSLKWSLNMDFWALWEEGGHWSVIRVEYGPELGLCYSELYPQHQPLVGEEIQTAPRINLEKLHLNSLLSLNSGARTITLGSRIWSHMELLDALSGHSFMNDFFGQKALYFFSNVGTDWYDHSVLRIFHSFTIYSKLFHISHFYGKHFSTQVIES